jgi:hypothetical protein
MVEQMLEGYEEALTDEDPAPGMRPYRDAPGG